MRRGKGEGRQDGLLSSANDAGLKVRISTRLELCYQRFSVPASP